MHTILVLAIAVGAATADVSLGYQYKVPQTSYGVPTYQGGSGSNSYYVGSSHQGQYLGPNQGQYLGSNQGQYLGSNQGQYVSSNQGQYVVPSYASGSGYENFGSTSFGTGIGSSGFSSSEFGSSYGNGGLGSNYFESSTLQPNYFESSSLQPSLFETSTLQPTYTVTGSNQYLSSNQFQSSSVNKYQENYQFVSQPAQVFKHFYVHAAPEELEEQKPKRPIVLPPPQKHYKIIFIKAPSQNYAPPVIPVQQQNEEKTIVYVLVKKGEDAQNIVLPKFEQKPPSKPEVYFIKYNNKDGSQAVINNIVNDYNRGGATVNYNAGEQQAIVTGGNLNYGGPLVQSGGSSLIQSSGASQLESEILGGLSGSQSSSSSSSYDVGSGSISAGPVINVSTVDNGSLVGESEGGSISSSSSSSSSTSSGSSSLTGGFSESSTLSSLNYDNSNLVSTSQGVPHESYGPPKFRS